MQLKWAQWSQVGGRSLVSLWGCLMLEYILEHSPAIPKGVKVEHEAVIDIQGNYRDQRCRVIIAKCSSEMVEEVGDQKGVFISWSL